MKAEAKALGKTSADVEVKEIKPAEPAKEEVKDSDKEPETKKTDAEKLKKKKEV